MMDKDVELVSTSSKYLCFWPFSKLFPRFELTIHYAQTLMHSLLNNTPRMSYGGLDRANRMLRGRADRP